MADAYGTLTLTKSNDCKFNAAKLVQVLNAYSWDNEGGGWEHEKMGGSLRFNSSRPQYPSVFPTKALSYVCYSDDTKSEYMRAENEMTNEDWDCVIASKDVEIELAELVNQIHPCLKSGWIEIAYASNEKQRYVEFGSIRVSKDGECYRRLIRSGPSVDQVDIFETL